MPEAAKKSVYLNPKSHADKVHLGRTDKVEELTTSSTHKSN